MKKAVSDATSYRTSGHYSSRCQPDGTASVASLECNSVQGYINSIITMNRVGGGRGGGAV